MPSHKRSNQAKKAVPLPKPVKKGSASGLYLIISFIVAVLAVMGYYQSDLLLRHFEPLLGRTSHSPSRRDSQTEPQPAVPKRQPHRNFLSDEDQESDWPFKVVSLPGKGKGVIATRHIERGELVLRESPLFLVPKHIESSPLEFISEKLATLTAVEREVFYNLSWVGLPEEMTIQDYPLEVGLGIIQTNAVSAGDLVGVFPQMARFNHGCSKAFNSVYLWREDERALVVHALQDIKKGQELLTTYTDTKRSREQRRAFLRQNYGFECQCDVCSLPDGESRESDIRLENMSQLYNEFARWGQREISGPEAIKVIEQIWQLGEEEGYTSERGQLAADAAWIAASHSDEQATRAWARKAAEWYSYEIGEDSAQVQEMRMVIERPQSFRPWGTREMMEV